MPQGESGTLNEPTNVVETSLAQADLDLRGHAAVCYEVRGTVPFR